MNHINRFSFYSPLGVMSREEEGLVWLKKANAIDPDMDNANVNLGSHYQDEGLLQEAAR